MKRFHLSRRSFLRAATATGVSCLGLPMLECMLNAHGTAFAQGEPLPVRFGIWFWGNGIQKDTWTPTMTGSDWTVADDWSLAPLLARNLKQQVTVVSGMQLPGGDLGQFPHVWGQTVLLSGRTGTEAGGLSMHMATSTVDQIIASQIGNTQPIVAAVNRRPSDNATLTEPNLSWIATTGDAGAAPVVPQRDPAAMFDQIFGASTQAPAHNRARASVLDAVAGQLRELQPRVSTADRARLEAHFTALRQLETELQNNVQLCGEEPTGLTGFDPNDASDAGMRARHDAMTKVIALALACDARTSFNLSFAGAGDQTPMPGQSNHPGQGLHALCHNSFQNPVGEDYETSQADVTVAMRYQIDRFADFLSYLANHEDFDGSSLLDSCAILATTELWDGNSHSYVEQPLIIAGSARGKLRLGQHIAASGNPCAAVLSLMRATIGPSVASYGEQEFQVTEGLSTFET